ncbi:hypothetical protein H4582DRAFT_2051278 [Lactarius indigo]|nr:hypothetical protein H4582DRAFT_2051278 [Lactarius indigo]
MAMVMGWVGGGGHPSVLSHVRQACVAQLTIYMPWETVRQLVRLTLFGFVCSRLPTAELTFLSACHTALMKDRNVADEALQLTPMIETVQAIADMDRQDLAECFYTPVFPPNGRRRFVVKKQASGELHKLRSVAHSGQSHLAPQSTPAVVVIQHAHFESTAMAPEA